jgi:hypothetical protein
MRRSASPQAQLGFRANGGRAVSLQVGHASNLGLHKRSSSRNSVAGSGSMSGSASASTTSGTAVNTGEMTELVNRKRHSSSVTGASTHGR